MVKKALILPLLAALMYAPADASEYSCEVMALKGSAQVVRGGSADAAEIKEGDLLYEGDQVRVGAGSYVDLAYDKEWNNLTRLGENSVTKIEALFPTGLVLDRGDLFAKLGRLPKGTTFEVRTPAAVAAARGTEFLVSVAESGATEVIGFENKVEVFNLDAGGNLGSGVVLESAQKTEVAGVDQPPAPPQPVGEGDLKRVEDFNAGVQESKQDVMSEGREGQTQTVGSVEALKILSDVYLKDESRRDSSTAAPTETRLNETQTKALRDQFVDMGGSEADFDQYKNRFNSVDPQTFDRTYNQFESTGMDPKIFDSTREPYQDPNVTAPTGETTVKEPEFRTGDFDSSMGPLPGTSPDSTFTPPNIDSIDRTTQQIQQNIEQTVTQTTTNLPPPDPCMIDPHKCTSTTGG